MQRIEKMELIQTIDNVNIGEKCRACFEKCGEYKMLFENAENIANRSLGDVFFDIVKIEATHDAESSLPNRICLPCSKDLISAYNFIQKSHQSNNRFLDYLKGSNMKPSDCLSEFPIDIPNEPASSDFLQIKVEDEIMNEYPYPQEDQMFASSCSNSESDDEPLLHKKGKINKMQCTYCGRIFKRLDFLENHKKKHEEEIMNKNEGESADGDLKMLCDDCGLSFTSKVELKNHRIANHPARVMSPEPEISNSSANQNNTVDKSAEAFFRLHENQPTLNSTQPTVSKDNHDILMLQSQINSLKETCLKEFKEIKALILQQNAVKDTKENKEIVRAVVESPGQKQKIQQEIPMWAFDKIFPINSDDQLHTLNNIGETHKLAAITTVKALIYNGGLTVNMNKVFGNVIVVNYNYEGKRGKKSLKDLATVNEILFRAAFTTGYSMANYESDLRKGFKIMKNRYFKNECIRRKKTDLSQGLPKMFIEIND